MSYYSKVAIVLTKEDYDELKNGASKEALETLESFTYGECKTPDEVYACLYNDFIEYQDYTKGVPYIKEFLKNHRHSFVDIGEDGNIVIDNVASDQWGTDEEFNEFLSSHNDIAGLEWFGIVNDEMKEKALYEAIHIFYSAEGMDKEKIASLLNLPVSVVDEALDYFGIEEAA